MRGHSEGSLCAPALFTGCSLALAFRFFADKVHLFHEIEYAHIVVFYLGLGLIVQGLALAIVNKELKTVWKYSTEQTLGDVSPSL